MRNVSGAALLLALAASAAQAQPLELGGIGVSRDVPCNGQDVIITGNLNKFRLGGACGQVSVDGVEHDVQLESATGLQISGAQSVVRAGRVGSLAVEGSEHRIEATLKADQQPATVELYGAENQVELELQGPVSMAVNGIEQQVDWRGDDPQIATSGAGHRIERK